MAALLTRARTEGAIRPDVAADDVVHLVCGIAHAIRAASGRPSDLYLDVLLQGLA